jgi:hypothetical protein
MERRAARRRPRAGIRFGLGRIGYENGLYMGPVLLYHVEEGGGFNFTGVAARPRDQLVASLGYVLLSKEPKVLWGEAAEREGALNMLIPLEPFERDAWWDELPQTSMAMDVEPWGYLAPHGGCSAASQGGSTSSSWSWTTGGTGPLQRSW